MIRTVLAVAWLLFLSVAMLTPGTKFPDVDLFDFQDKAIHLFCFGVQGFLWSGVGIKGTETTWSNPKVRKNFLLYGLVIGIILESLQYFIPNRSFELMDMSVNAIGAFLGLLCYFRWPLNKFILD